MSDNKPFKNIPPAESEKCFECKREYLTGFGGFICTLCAGHLQAENQRLRERVAELDEKIKDLMWERDILIEKEAQ